jgi:uncharacterized membrane protein
MSLDTPRSTAQIGGHPLHAMLAPIAFACFLGTFVTDLVYGLSGDFLWVDMSDWLLTIGLFISVVVVIAGLIDFFGDRRIRALRDSWIHGLANAVALGLAIVNGFVHTRDAYGEVVPTGLLLSTVTLLILIFAGWRGWSLVYRHGVGVAPEEPLTGRLEDRR